MALSTEWIWVTRSATTSSAAGALVWCSARVHCPGSVATIVPISTTAQPAVFRPSIKINGQQTRILVDQIRSIDTDYIIGDPVHYLEHDELAEVEHAVARYLGL
ncbi:MAG: type II toxin-antitoxin system PemK/MazF family toxin [Pseudonocardiaceae bacterium]